MKDKEEGETVDKHNKTKSKQELEKGITKCWRTCGKIEAMWIHDCNTYTFIACFDGTIFYFYF